MCDQQSRRRLQVAQGSISGHIFDAMTNTGSPSFQEVHRLIKKSNILALRDALDSGLDPNLTNQFSWSLLMLTAIEGNTAIGELLFAHGAELHTANDSGDTALSLAAHAGHEPFVL